MSAPAGASDPAQGERPLIAAVQASDHARVAALLDAGHDVHARGDEEWPALCFAAGRGDLAMVRLLIARGADVFATGRDGRTPYLIALAASHGAVARELRQREEALGGDSVRTSSRAWERRPYCKAYHLDDLRAHPFWRAAEFPPSSRAALSDEAPGDDDLVFVHDDYSVTRSIWRDRDVLFDGRTSDWRQFCETTLGFRVPRDLDDDGDAGAGGEGGSDPVP